MKKWLIVLAMVLLASTAFGQETKQVTITWTQTLPNPNDLQGWHVYHSTTPGGPYTTAWATIPYSAPPHSTVQSLPVPPGTSNHCFVLDAYDTQNNTSAKSVEVCRSVTASDTTPPAIPVILNVVIQ